MALVHKITFLHFTAVIYSFGHHCIFLLKAHPCRSIVPFRRKGSQMLALWRQHTATIDFDNLKNKFFTLCLTSRSLACHWRSRDTFLNKPLLTTAKYRFLHYPLTWKQDLSIFILLIKMISIESEYALIKLFSLY